VLDEAHSRRSFIHVVDMARGILHALDNYDRLRGRSTAAGARRRRPPSWTLRSSLRGTPARLRRQSALVKLKTNAIPTCRIRGSVPLGTARTSPSKRALRRW
jgi:hypothetical protein